MTSMGLAFGLLALTASVCPANLLANSLPQRVEQTLASETKKNLVSIRRAIAERNPEDRECPAPVQQMSVVEFGKGGSIATAIPLSIQSFDIAEYSKNWNYSGIEQEDVNTLKSAVTRNQCYKFAFISQAEGLNLFQRLLCLDNGRQDEVLIWLRPEPGTAFNLFLGSIPAPTPTTVRYFDYSYTTQAKDMLKVKGRCSLWELYDHDDDFKDLLEQIQ
jgi:hypothetical protein